MAGAASFVEGSRPYIADHSFGESVRVSVRASSRRHGRHGVRMYVSEEVEKELLCIRTDKHKLCNLLVLAGP